MKNKKKIIGVTAVSLVMGSTIVTANAANNKTDGFKRPPAMSVESFQAEKTAVEKGDYAAWKAAVEKNGNSKILETINESNFGKYAEAFNLRESGDMSGSKQIMDELGLKNLGQGKGAAGHGNPVSKENRDAIENAIKNSDYACWKAVVEKLPGQNNAGLLAEDKFSVIVQAYKLKEGGDIDGAMALLKENKIPCGMFLGGGDKGRGLGEEEIVGVDQEKLMQTYQNKDYSAWKALMGERGGKILDVINESNFSKFAEAKILQLEGKQEEARAIFKELGLPFQDRGRGLGMDKQPVNAVQAATSVSN